MQIMLVRHGQSVGNIGGHFSHAEHDQLTNLGHEQAAALAKRLADEGIDHICCSPLKRAAQTIIPFLEGDDREAEIWPELAECSWHPEPSVPAETWREEACTLNEALLTRMRFRDGRAIQPVADEDYAEGLLRVRQCRELLRERFADEDTILLVSHGHFIREFLNVVLECGTRVRFPQVNTALTRLTLGRPPVLQYSNCTLHLASFG